MWSPEPELGPRVISHKLWGVARLLWGERGEGGAVSVSLSQTAALSPPYTSCYQLPLANFSLRLQGPWESPAVMTCSQNPPSFLLENSHALSVGGP